MVDSKHKKFYIFYSNFWASLVAQLVNNPPAMWETWVQSLGWEDLLDSKHQKFYVFYTCIYLFIKSTILKKHNNLKAFTKP